MVGFFVLTNVAENNYTCIYKHLKIVRYLIKNGINNERKYKRILVNGRNAKAKKKNIETFHSIQFTKKKKR